MESPMDDIVGAIMKKDKSYAKSINKKFQDIVNRVGDLEVEIAGKLKIS